MKKDREIRYYHSFTDEFVENSHQDYALPEDYVWIRSDRKSGFKAKIYYFAGWLFGIVYARFVLHVKIVRNIRTDNFSHSAESGSVSTGSTSDFSENTSSVTGAAKRHPGKHSRAKSGLKNFPGGMVVYANHTQMIGDVFTPILVCRPKRGYTIVSPANLGLPVIGKILPDLGALPIPGDFRHMKQFTKAVQERLAQGGCVFVYPEAHVWPYCTYIRPYPDTAFSYAVENHVPAFCMTTTYQKRKHGKTPRQTVYLDGPFYADETLSRHEQRKKLHDEVYACMLERSKESNFEYIIYRPAEDGQPSD